MKYFILIPLYLLKSCTMVSYLTEQGIEQAKIQWNGRNNAELISNSSVDDETKRKITLIEEYKKYFYSYFKKKETGIYSKTTFLPNKAATYLVIASPHTKIKAYDFDFPLMGSFPYIGFFNKNSAEEFASDLRKNENLVTYIRPVYAYSSLGYFEDRILSSFFHFDDIELAELVFHELFHTIFFPRDEVDLNENLANYFSKAMLLEYFNGRVELKNYLENETKKTKLSQRIVELISILNSEFQKLGVFITDKRADELTLRFIKEVFTPEILSFCQDLNLPEEDCEVKDEWNQASFAAFLTYEEEQDFLSSLREVKKLGLKDYFSWLNREYETYKMQDKIKSFTDYLKLHLKVGHATTYTH